MASKNFRGKICVYCAAATAETADHVVCRSFFDNRLRRNLPKAPACKQCNGLKSELEHYLTAVLPFASGHHAALRGQQEVVRRRLANNASLREKLRAGMRHIGVHTADGIVEDRLAMPFDGEAYKRYLVLVARGLVWTEWKVVVPADYFVRAYSMTARRFVDFQRTILHLGENTRVRRSLAEGAFVYTGACAIDDPAFSTWKIDLYENVDLVSHEVDGRHHEIASAVLTGPPDMAELFQRLQRACDVVQ